MSKDKTYLCGSTVRLIGEFFDFEGTPTNVSFVKVIIYDYKYNKLAEFNLTDSHKLADGKYFYDYVTDMIPKKIIYEFRGELDGLPALDRNSFATKFI